MYFSYGAAETEYLMSKDKKLAEVIRQVGHIYREVDTDLFTSVVRHIIGQQVSSKAMRTVWGRIEGGLGEINADTVLETGVAGLQQYGTTFRKAEYIVDFAAKVKSGEFDLEGISRQTDEEAIASLSALKGIGVWTAEMILLFCLQRPDVLSYGDLAILRGMRMVYHHKEIDRQRFERYRKRFSPCCSVASLYFWAVAGGAIPGCEDYAVRKPSRPRK